MLRLPKAQHLLYIDFSDAPGNHQSFLTLIFRVYRLSAPGLVFLFRRTDCLPWSASSRHRPLTVSASDDDGGGSPRKRPHLAEEADDPEGASRPKHLIAGRAFDNLDEDLDRLPTEELRDILKEVDPVSWKLRHDMDRRKIKR